ncbi:MFS transporter [Burkholderia sp. Ac-20379]|uniref:MFS transporter n=1 Tax=Burkholderia sp. Ac-20379 TaxID=2703900 RepID=UPI00197DD0A1|nr:MFS transporter [Burkholderia sp. Ac-20379]MBN3727101.1 MFS transporter [Burkholderia sp. Ac-20379]
MNREPAGACPRTADIAIEQRICRRLAWQVLPVMMLAYLAAYIDRTNVSFASLQLHGQLGFSDAVFGFGAGVFSLGYVVFELPSNMILQRVGARLWLTRIILVWGAVTAFTALVATPKQFYVMRYLLGIAEAGLVPGIVYYLSRSFPCHYRARMLSTFYAALPLSGVIGAPLAGLIMQDFDGALQIAGWKWMLIVESLPACVAALFCWWRLDDDVTTSPRYSPEDRAHLVRALERDRASSQSIHPDQVYSSPLVLAFGALYFFDVFAIYGYTLWAPAIVHSLGVSGNLRISLITVLPNLVAIAVMIAVGRNADRTRSRRLHVAALLFVAALGLALAALLHRHLWLSVAGLCIANACLLSVPPVFWSMPITVLGPASAANGIAWISAIGNLGGFFGPYTVGHLKQSSGSLLAPVVTMIGCLLLGVVLTLLLPKRLVDG